MWEGKAMSKILFIDVDGTLVDYENKLPESAVRAIRAARANGHRVYVCTGRSKAEMYPYLWDIGLDGMIGGNGSYVEDHGEVVMHQLIPADTARRIVDWLHSRKLEFYLESNNGLFGSENFKTAAQPAMREYRRRKGKPDDDQHESFPQMIFGAELYRDDLNKISYLLGSYQDYLDTRAQFPDMQNGTWGGAGETALFGDIGVQGITKANAIEHLLAHLGADRADTIAFGDAKIDIPMLEYCAYGVSMGNGGPEIRAMADYITDDVDNDGLYKAFAHLGLL
jgi:hypothetical protein